MFLKLLNVGIELVFGSQSLFFCFRKEFFSYRMHYRSWGFVNFQQWSGDGRNLHQFSGQIAILLLLEKLCKPDYICFLRI